MENGTAVNAWSCTNSMNVFDLLAELNTGIMGTPNCSVSHANHQPVKSGLAGIAGHPTCRLPVS